MGDRKKTITFLIKDVPSLQDIVEVIDDFDRDYSGVVGDASVTRVLWGVLWKIRKVIDRVLEEQEHRILIEVDGGVVKWTADPSVEVELINHDDAAVTEGVHKGQLPSRFHSLAPHVDEAYFKKGID